MRRLGKGYAGLKKFCYLMNHPPPMSEKSFRETNIKIYDAVKVVAEKSLKDASEDVKIIDGIQSNGYCHIYFGRWDVAPKRFLLTPWCCCGHIHVNW